MWLFSGVFSLYDKSFWTDFAWFYKLKKTTVKLIGYKNNCCFPNWDSTQDSSILQLLPRMRLWWFQDVQPRFKSTSCLKVVVLWIFEIILNHKKLVGSFPPCSDVNPEFTRVSWRTPPSFLTLSTTHKKQLLFSLIPLPGTSLRYLMCKLLS